MRCYDPGMRPRPEKLQIVVIVAIVLAILFFMGQMSSRSMVSGLFPLTVGVALAAMIITLYRRRR